jgi:hypothetical protein
VVRGRETFLPEDENLGRGDDPQTDLVALNANDHDFDPQARNQDLFIQPPAEYEHDEPPNLISSGLDGHPPFCKGCAGDRKSDRRRAFCGKTEDLQNEKMSKTTKLRTIHPSIEKRTAQLFRDKGVNS